MDDQPAGCSTRSLALGGLAAYSVTALLIVLTLAFPTFGTGPDVYVPVQAIFGLLGGLFTIIVALALAVRCVVAGWRGRQWAWLSVFLLLSLAGLFGPVFLLTQMHISQASWHVVAPVSSVAVLLVLVAALLYTLPSRHPGQA
jgi:hypothetical protein